MRGGMRIGAIFGIPLYIHPTWLLILFLLAWMYSEGYQNVSSRLALTSGLVTAFLVLGSILLHELGHSLVAKAQGIEVKSVTLFLFGGIASIAKEPKDPLSNLALAAAGPLVNLVIGSFLAVVAWFALGDQAILLGTADQTQEVISGLAVELGVGRALVSLMALNLAVFNIVIGLFNLIPALPLDGGQVLKSIVWKITGSRFSGIRWAAYSGQIIGIFTMLLGFSALFAQALNGIFFIFVGWFVFNSATVHLQYGRLQQALLEIDAESAMTRDFRIVDADMSLRRFADDFLLMQEKDKQPIFFAASDGRDRGMVNADELRYIERERWEQEDLHSIVKPLQSLDVVDLSTKIPRVIDMLEQKELPYVTVLSPAGSVTGIVDRGDVIRALARRLNWRIPEAYIKRIKAEGKFPPELKLTEITSQL
ncbi:peptidase M50 [Thalassoporum mexicanum PCC 7367]|uniref:site-2 protease family protein n=1 Tax=Thalassoporum mexicanum TaxID=3457544 RepID=UPI00029F8B63|nr:site-2 protease family protein [Pseudanabaena sp. PCC 7367]AFY70216.1 peptidase M50 [Pseudanabaena sp. PCC 7367]